VSELLWACTHVLAFSLGELEPIIGAGQHPFPLLLVTHCGFLNLHPYSSFQTYILVGSIAAAFVYILVLLPSNLPGAPPRSCFLSSCMMTSPASANAF
jgi:hypothetical protein